MNGRGSVRRRAGAQCIVPGCEVTENDGGILAQKGGAYLCLAHHNANHNANRRRAIQPEPEDPEEPEEPEEPAPPVPERDYVVRARGTRKPNLSVRFVAENKATEDAERVRRNMELFESAPKYNFARPGTITSAHKRREEALVARAPKGKIAQLDPTISARFNFTKFV